MTKKINFLNIPIDAITMQETLQKVENAIVDKNQIHHTVVNAGKIVLIQTDKELEKSVIGADIIFETLEKYIGEYTTQLDLSKNSKGIYFLQIETDYGIINKKLILE